MTKLLLALSLKASANDFPHILDLIAVAILEGYQM